MAGLNNNANAFLTQVRLGPQYIQLVPGPPGPDGQNAVTTTTTANFTQPPPGSTVSVAVTTTAAIVAGIDVFIAGGGYYSVISVTDGTHAVIQNTGAAGNTGTGTTVPLGSLVIPAGPAGSLTIQNAGSAITQRPILDLVGLQYNDDAGGNRMVFTGVSFGAPVTASGGAHTMQPGERWGIINPDEDWTMPAAPVVGIELVFTQQGTGYGAGHPTRFHGNGSNMQHPSVPGTQAAIVQAQTDGVLSYRFCFDGSLWRCLN